MAGPYAGYTAQIYLTGVSTAITNEPCNNVTGDIWQITLAGRRILDPGVDIVVKDSLAATVTASKYSIDYLFGKIDFNDTAGYTPPYTLDGNYFPRYAITRAKEFSFEVSNEILDKTVVNSAQAFREYKSGLRMASGSISLLDFNDNDFDTGAGEKKFVDMVGNGTEFVLELILGASSRTFRTWCILEADEVSSDIGDLVSSSASWVSISKPTNDALSDEVNFGFSDE